MENPLIMTEQERTLVRQMIAGIIDKPNIYMGGPSKMALKKADKIIADLESSKRLVTTTCDHDGWMTYAMHGTHCPDCWTDLHKSDESE